MANRLPHMKRGTGQAVSHPQQQEIQNQQVSQVQQNFSQNQQNSNNYQQNNNQTYQQQQYPSRQLDQQQAFQQNQVQAQSYQNNQGANQYQQGRSQVQSNLPYNGQGSSQGNQTNTNYSNQEVDLRRQSSGNAQSGNTQSGNPPRKSSKVQQDSIPHPLSTYQESLQLREFVGSQVLQTNAPFSFSYFSEKDEGNAGPRYIRPTVYGFANEPNLMQLLQIPQGCVIQPFRDAEEPVQSVPFIQMQGNTTPQAVIPNNENNNVDNGIVETIFRCTRCHAYVNPFFKFVEGGNTAVCNICSKPNKVPAEYFCPLTITGERSDKQSRPELSKGVYDMIAPKNYPKKVINQNYITICLELSTAAVQSGVFGQALFSIQAALSSIPAQERTSISICTYSSQLQFYSIPKDLSNDPQIIVVADLEEPFCPFPKNALFLNVSTDREKIDYLIEKLQKASEIVIQQQTKPSASIASIVSSIESMLEQNPARIIVFGSQLPQVGLGKLKRRDDVKLMNTENEKVLYTPQCKIYQELGALLLKQAITVDIFMFCPDYCDLSTVQSLCTETGGQIYFYPHYSPADAEKIHYELFRNLTRQYSMDCLMTLRTSPGIILEDFLSTKGKVGVRDFPFSSMNPDSVIAISYKQEEKITTQESYLQYACLHTNQEGVNMIRVINLCLQVQNQVQALYKLADLDATLSFLLRKSLSNLTLIPIKTIQDQLLQQIVNIFYSYRNNCAASSSPSQLILPESIKYLIVYSLAFFKSEVFRSQQPKPDNRIYEAFRLQYYPLHQVSALLYPRVYPIHSIYIDEDHENTGVNQTTYSSTREDLPGNYISETQVALPSTIPCSLDRLSSFGIYLIDNGETIYLYVQKDADPVLLEYLFGVQDYEQIREIQQFPALNESDYAQRVNAIIDQIRRNRNGAFQNVKIVLYKDPFEPMLKSLFIEDEIRGVMNYNSFICDIHKRIQQKYTS